MLQILPQTCAAGSSYLELVGRTLLQIFITTTPNHRLNRLSSDPVAQR